MSLSDRQKADSRRELRENLEKSGLTVEEVARRLGTDESYVEDLLAMAPRRIEDPWVLRNLLIQAVREAGGELTPFTAMAGDWHDHWFLDAAYIDRGRIGR